MTYLTYLKSKSKLLVIWFIINGFALFVNVFNIRGYIYSEKRLHIDLFTSGYWDSKSDDFWPIVEFYGERYSQWGEYYYSHFKGIFYNYDISEFIAYGLLIFIILYFRYESKKSKLKKQNTTN